VFLVGHLELHLYYCNYISIDAAMQQEIGFKGRELVNKVLLKAGQTSNKIIN